MTVSDKPKILMAEDEELIAMILEDILSDAGYEVVPASTLTSALGLSTETRMDAAILDVNLGREEVFPLAAQLQQQGVPFLFASGYGDENIPPEFSGHEVLLKPFGARMILDAVGRLLKK
jgi:DNA-binding response OmpR family regulator